MSQYLGDISAYALAVSQGYTGTEEEYAELMASYATVGQTAVTAAQTATTKASEAATSATTATNKASEATTAATTATTKAGEASTSASTATSAKDTAVSASQTATSKATEATTAAATAVSAKTDAVAANTAAQSAKTAAQTAQTGAETAAASVSASAAQITTNAEDISQLKSAIDALNGACEIYAPQTSNGTTLVSSSHQTVLSPLALVAGRRYKFEVDYETASDQASYLSLWNTGGASYLSVITINAGATHGSNEYLSIIDTDAAYIAIQSNNRALNYTVKFTDLGEHLTYMQKNEKAIDAVSADVDSLEEKVDHIGSNAVVSKPDITITDITSDMTWSIGFVSDTGVVDSTNTSYKKTAKISVSEGETYSTIGTVSYRHVCAYNGDTVVSASGGSVLSHYVVPKGITHIIISIYSSQSTESGTVIKTTTEYEYFNSADALNIRQTDDITPVNGFSDGYVNKDGYNDSSSTSYLKTGVIPVRKGDAFYTTSTTTPYRYVCAYLNGSPVSAKGAENVYKYTVPEGVDSIRITIYSNQNKQNGTIYKTFDSYCKKPVEHRSTDFAVRKPMITFIDDDGYKSFATYITPIMRNKEIPYCTALMGDANPAFTKTEYLNKADCDEIISLGGEILVHGGTNLTEFSTLAEAEANVLASQNALAGKGFYSDVYVYPNSGNNIEIREMISKHFKCAFKTAYPQKYDTRCNDKCVPSYFIHRSSCGGYYDDKTSQYGNYDTWTLDYFKALIDDTIAKKGWLVFMTHVWMMPIGCQWRLDHDAASGIPADLDEFALLESIIDYAKAQGVDIVTASEGFEVFGNAVQTGDYLGYWNENTTPTTGYEHTQPGTAINKVGQYDMPDSNKITH